MTFLSSRQNPKIKQIRALGSRKQRDAQGLFVVEGIRHTGEAVESGSKIEFLLYAPDLLTSDYAYSLITQAELTNIPVYSTPPDVFSYVAGKENPQGILAVVHHNLKPISYLTQENLKFGVVILAPQDPGNLGTILRTLDSAGADGMIVLEHGTDIFHPTAVRASMGTLFWKPIVYTSFAEFSAWQKVQNYHIYGSSAHGDADYDKVDFQTPALLMLGSEREGLSKEHLALCETVLRMPMRGRATSLNLSVAAGILLYEMGKKIG